MSEQPFVQPAKVGAEPLAAVALKALETRATLDDLPPATMLPPFQSSPEFSALDAQGHFRKIEELLRRTLQTTELPDQAALALNRPASQQRDCNLLVIELLTTLFEGQRALLYQTALLTSATESFQQFFLSLAQAQAVQRQEAEERIAALEALCAELKFRAGA
jgi:hypothetical protein